MTSLVTSWILLPLLAPSVLARTGGADGDGRPSGFGMLAPASSERLVSYAWDGGGEVPAPAPRADGRTWIPWGEAGAPRAPGFYVPFQRDGEGSLVHAGRAGTVSERGAADGEGLYGAGLVLPSAGARVTVSADEGPVLGPAWTVELWVRLPAEPEPGPVLRGDDVLTLALEPDGHATLSVRTEPAVRLKSTEPLRPDAWNHLGVTLDGPDLRQVRLSVNGVAQGKLVEGGASARTLTVGGGVVGTLDELVITSWPRTSADLEERWLCEPRPGEHELELRYEGRTETLRPWCGALERPAAGQPAGAGADAWAGLALEHAAVRDGVVRWTPGDWTRYRCENAPPPRTTHPTVFLGGHRVLIYGGETRDSLVGGMRNTTDTWIFRTDTGEWRRSGSLETPPPACHQSAALDPLHDVVLYAGGWHNEGGAHHRFDQTWLYHVDEDRWERREPAGVELPETANGGAVWLPRSERFLLYAGGRRMLAYDPVANVWEQLPSYRAVNESGEPVDYLPGGSPMTGYDPGTGKVVFFGGGFGRPTGEHWQDTTALYDPEEGTMTVLEGGPAPSGRVRSGFAYDSRRGRFVLFGGVLGQFSERMDDLWTFSAGERRWTRVDAANTPSARGGYYGMAYDPELDLFVLLCGRHSPTRFLNEAWALHLDEAAVGRATLVFDRAAFPGAERWSARWRAPEGAAVSFRFRAGADGLAWGPWETAVEDAATAEARFVQVEVELRAGGPDAAPELLGLGFGSAGSAGRGALPDGASGSTVRVAPWRGGAAGYPPSVPR